MTWNLIAPSETRHSNTTLTWYYALFSFYFYMNKEFARKTYFSHSVKYCVDEHDVLLLNLRYHSCSSMMAWPGVNKAQTKCCPLNQKRKENTTDPDLRAWLGCPAHHRKAVASSAHQGGRGGWEWLAAGDSCWFWCSTTRLFHQSTGWSLHYRTESCWQEQTGTPGHEARAVHHSNHKQQLSTDRLGKMKIR